ncbi:uncharacterized protein LOC129593207 [Paramacrobiotus metropolitanus]|uniref:uncharacterized protein LOC129593207 n=1 Tax=Paramacrobiotus metropolitanus TaxID=2943436 RepID=UPI002445D3E6|nr:uncharacterized protein LOC129593207 [Paramacrobiotus metropolitanus]
MYHSSLVLRKIALILSIVGLILFVILAISLLLSRDDPYTTYHNLPLEAIIPDPSAADIVAASDSNLPVHLVRLYRRRSDRHALCWFECLAVLSMLAFLRPTHIYLHTNYPDFWPFDTCSGLIRDWSAVRVVPVRRRYHANGRRMNHVDQYIAHEADMIKFITLYKYGGLFLDFDVFILPNITTLLDELQTHDCITTKEHPKYNPDALNSGFIACRPQTPFIADILRRYRNDYRPEWTYNSGYVPFGLYNSSRSATYRQRIYIDETVIQNEAEAVWNSTTGLWRAEGVFEWRQKAAYHAVFHNCSLNEETLRRHNTSLAQLMRFVLDNGRASL